jgi:hypothetical protein
MITEENITHLFEYLWPRMSHSQPNKKVCLNQLKPIQNYFINSGSDHNVLLIRLSS